VAIVSLDVIRDGKASNALQFRILQIIFF